MPIMLDQNVTLSTAIEVSGLGKVIDDRPILSSLSFSIPAGQCVALIGANGAGKSTLLSILSLLAPASSGSLALMGQKVGRANTVSLRARIGLVGHQPMLYRDLTCMENLVFFGRLYGLARPKDRALDLLKMVRLDPRADDAARTLSRGMVQRLAIARALVHDPSLLLADEPFAGLDVPSSEDLEKLIHTLHAAGKTVLLSSHDLAQTLRLAQRVLCIKRGRLVLDKPAGEVSDEQLIREVLR